MTEKEMLQRVLQDMMVLKKIILDHISGSKAPEAAGNRVIAGDVVCLDAADNLVWSNGRLVALLGVEGLAVVDTGDVILVTRLDRSPDVRRLVGLVKAHGRDGLT